MFYHNRRNKLRQVLTKIWCGVDIWFQCRQCNMCRSLGHYRRTLNHTENKNKTEFKLRLDINSIILASLMEGKKRAEGTYNIQLVEEVSGVLNSVFLWLWRIKVFVDPEVTKRGPPHLWHFQRTHIATNGYQMGKNSLNFQSDTFAIEKLHAQG